jgi:hypothetical protein
MVQTNDGIIRFKCLHLKVNNSFAIEPAISIKLLSQKYLYKSAKDVIIGEQPQRNVRAFLDC